MDKNFKKGDEGEGGEGEEEEERVQQLFDLNKSVWVGTGPEALAPVWPGHHPSVLVHCIIISAWCISLNAGCVENPWLGVGAGEGFSPPPLTVGHIFLLL